MVAKTKDRPGETAADGAKPPMSASTFIPPNPTLDALRAAAAGCTACPLHLRGTQTVFGTGPDDAALMLVGEQPGEVEDRTGRPFVGPAGKLLDHALEAAGIDRARAYVTNAVKHFKWTPRGKRRLHSKPNAMEIRACSPWLEAEIAVIGPRVIVCLGATAAQALLGPDVRVTRHRGTLISSNLAPYVTVTIHPSAILRIADDQAREEELRHFIDDLRSVARLLD